MYQKDLYSMFNYACVCIQLTTFTVPIYFIYNFPVEGVGSRLKNLIGKLTTLKLQTGYRLSYITCRENKLSSNVIFKMFIRHRKVKHIKKI